MEVEEIFFPKDGTISKRTKHGLDREYFVMSSNSCKVLLIVK